MTVGALSWDSKEVRGMGLTRLITSSPCSTSLRMWDTIRCLAASKSCCLALASRTQAWYSASASCTWRTKGRCGRKHRAGGTEALLGHAAESPPWPGPLPVSAAVALAAW